MNVYELTRFTTRPYRCHYLPDQTASLTYRILIDIRAADYEDMLQRGWRRFGCEFFRPACPACVECRSLRLRLQDFAPSRRQRRALKANADIEVVVQSPTVTPEHVRLYNAYHQDMAERKQWPYRAHNLKSYYENFVMGEWDFARELQYYADGRLVGVALADVTPHALTSIYFYHDPAWRPRSPGVFSILQQVVYGKQLGLVHQYLGYWVPGSRSMDYKAQYRPHEILARYPEDDEAPVWLDPESAASSRK
jgi:arginine-tRNA-protein transferase